MENAMSPQESPPFRVGFGHDIHRTRPGGPLILCGVHIPCDFGLAGHSDADAALHALSDALLGAVGRGDIGEMFPNTDPALSGADSARFVEQTLEVVRSAGYQPSNVDLMILAEAPKLAPHKEAMRARVAALMGLPESAVSVKAGTNEGCDAIGRGEAIACTAAVLVSRT